MIGDAIHILRTALDFAWIATLGHFNIPTNHFAKFPIRPSEKELTTALQGEMYMSPAPTSTIG